MKDDSPSRRASRVFDAPDTDSDTGVQLRAARPADAAAAGAICHDAFQAIATRHGFAPDFPDRSVATGLLEQLLAREDIHGVIAESAGRVVGSNFLWEGDAVAGVGPITVDPAVQDGAIGRALMSAVLARAQRQGLASVRLVQAAYHARSMALYAKLGFVVREPLVALQGAALDLRIEGHRVRPAVLTDLTAANAVCRAVHGHDRSRELYLAIRQGSAAVVEHDGRITGYTTGVAFFGHSVGESTDDVKALVAAAREFGGPGFLVPTRNAALLQWGLAQGLRIVMPLTLMSSGPYHDPQGAFLPSILY